MERFCWICGDKANSKEHIIKKKDIVRANGHGPYKGNSAILHYKNGKESLVQGPDSKVLKYSASLCHRCNTHFTQPFDQAYDTFIDWAMQNEDTVLRKRQIDFAEIYGDDFEPSQRDLYKYFAKSFGCRVVDAGAPVPLDVIDLLKKTSFLTALRLTFAVNEDALILPIDDRKGFIGKGDLIAWASQEDSPSPDYCVWHERVSWLTVCYWYNYPPIDNNATVWVADRRYLYFGSYAPLDDEMRADLWKKVVK